MSEFKLGDVVRAVAHDGSVYDERVTLTRRGWIGTNGFILQRLDGLRFEPLLVLDPVADRDKVYDAYREAAVVADVDSNREGMGYALLALANPEPPVPPKPDEPLRLGATAKDRNGLVWLRVGRGLVPGARVWAPVGEVTNGLRWRAYSDIDVVEVDVDESG